MVLTNQKAGKGPRLSRCFAAAGPGSALPVPPCRPGDALRPAGGDPGLRRAATGGGGPGEGAQDPPAGVQLVPRPVRQVRG